VGLLTLHTVFRRWRIWPGPLRHRALAGVPTLHRVFVQFRRCEVAKGLRVHGAGLAGEGEEFAAAAEQTGDVALERAGFGGVAAVAEAGGADTGAAFLCAGAGAFAAMQAAAAVAHGGGAAGTARAAGAGPAARGEVGVAARVAIAQRAAGLTVYRVFRGGSHRAAPPVILAQARIQGRHCNIRG
jgi:hypothetical protein